MIKKKYYKLILYGFLFGIMIWILDAVIDSQFLGNGTFFESLIVVENEHQHEIIYRLMFVMVFTLIGLFSSIILSKRDITISDYSKKTSVADFIVGGIFILGLSLFLITLDVTEALGKLSDKWGEFHLGELFISLFIIMAVIVVFAYRRWSESVREVKRLKDVENVLRDALKRVEDEKARTEGVLSSIGDGISIQDRNFRVMYQNDAHRKLIKGDFKGELCYKAYAGLDAVCEGCPVAGVFKGGSASSLIKNYPPPDGYIEINATPLKDASGNIIAGIEAVRDISSRMKMEDELRASEHKFRNLFESSPISLWEEDFSGIKEHLDTIRSRGISDIETFLDEYPEDVAACMSRMKVLDVNKATLQQYKAESKEELMNNLQKIFTEETLSTFKLGLAKIFNGEIKCEQNAVTYTLDGKKLFNTFSWSVVPGHESDYSKVVLSISDITESRLADEALRESEKQYRSLAENLPAIVYRVNFTDDRKVQFFNSMLKPMTGYQYEKIGENEISCIEKIILHEDRDHVREVIKSSIANDTVFNVEYRIVHKSGELRYFQEYGIPVRGTDGIPRFIDGVIFDITSRKKIEEELMQSKLDWEETFDTISDMITIHDNDFNVIRANKAAREILKLGPPELKKSLKCYKYYHGKSSPPTDCPSCACVKTGAPASFEIYEPYLKKHFEVRAMPRLSTTGKMLGVSHVVRDITQKKNTADELMKAHDLLETRVNERTVELKNANEQLLFEIGERMQLQHDLEESEKRYRRFFEDSPSSLFEQDFSAVKKYIEKLKKRGIKNIREYLINNPDDLRLCASLIKLTDVNETAVDLYGAESKDDFILNVENIFTEETFDIILEEVTAILEMNYTLSTEGVTKKFNGQENHVAIKWSVPADSEESLNKVLVSVIDISERRNAEELLRESEGKFRRLSQEFNVLLDAIPDNLLLLNRDMKIVWANKTATERFELQDHNSSDMKCFLTCCKLSSTSKKCPTRRCFQTGRAAISQIISPLGDIFDIRAYPIKDETGETKNVIEVMRDITGKIKMEEESKFIQAKLIHTNKMTALGTLVSGVAHEINNPNTFIMSNAELLSTIWKDVNSVLAEYYSRHKALALGGLPYLEVRDAMPRLLKGINEGSNRIKLIIDNLKDFSRPERTSLDDDVDINEAVKVSVSMLDSQIKNYCYNFKTHCVKDIPNIKGNKQQLEQVIINLLMNALQSLTDKDAAVRVSTFYNSEMDSVQITIKDEGGGMSDDIIERITEPFFTTKIDSGGTGLGLSISYAIINDHNGTMKFESTEGKGTSVVIKLPRSRR